MAERPEITPEEYQDFRVCSLKSWATFMLAQNGEMPDPETLLQTLLRDAEQARLFAPGVSNRKFITTSPYPVYEFKGFVFEADAGLLNNPSYGHPRELTQLQAKLFEFLIAHAPHTLTLSYLAQKALGDQPEWHLRESQKHTKLHNHIARIREVIGDYDLGNKRADFFLIRSKWGLGYAFDPADRYEDYLLKEV